MNKITTWLPKFPGFYESDLSFWIDQELEYAIEGMREEVGDLSWDEAYEKLEKDFDYRKAELAVAQGYLEVWSETYEVPASMVSIDSPREYNFTTDRLEIEVPEKFLMDLGKRCIDGDLKEEFAETLKKWFTSYDGFMSFYSNDPEDEEWKDLENYDMNQWSAVLNAYVESTGESFEGDRHEIYEAAQEGWIV